MKFLANGAMIFDDLFELTYELLNEMEISVRPDGIMVDNNTGNIFAINGNIIKASISPYDIKYAGQGEVELDLLGNIKMVTYLFGHYVEMKQKEGMPFVSWFQEEREEADIKYSSLTIKFDSVNSTTTHYYHNRCLKFLEMIFILDNQLVDLSNFDIIEGA